MSNHQYKVFIYLSLFGSLLIGPLLTLAERAIVGRLVQDAIEKATGCENQGFDNLCIKSFNFEDWLHCTVSNLTLKAVRDKTCHHYSGVIVILLPFLVVSALFIILSLGVTAKFMLKTWPQPGYDVIKEKSDVEMAGVGQMNYSTDGTEDGIVVNYQQACNI